MAGINRNFERDTYHLKPLPVKLGEEVIAKTREFMQWLESSGSTTHPDVRAIYHAVSQPLAMLVGQVEASKIREAGGGPDEIDAWLENGLGGSK